MRSYMETERLKYFAVVAESGSLTKASEILGISHSGLSKAIAALEQESKLELFRPKGRGLEITEDGKWFYLKAREILSIVTSFTERPHSPMGSLRIGVSGVIAMTCAGLITAEFEDRPLSISEIDVGEVEAKILSGDLDFGVTFVPSPQPELEYLKLGELRFATWARRDLLERVKSKELPFATPLLDYPSNPIGYQTRDGWPVDLPRQVRFRVSGFAVALDLLRQGEAAVYMPDFVAELENERSANRAKLVKVEAFKAAETKRKVFLVKRQSSEESSAMKKVAKVVRKLC
jgi:DNA-binding transcriptional LysR family regulator